MKDECKNISDRLSIDSSCSPLGDHKYDCTEGWRPCQLQFQQHEFQNVTCLPKDNTVHLDTSPPDEKHIPTRYSVNCHSRGYKGPDYEEPDYEEPDYESMCISSTQAFPGHLQFERASGENYTRVAFVQNSTLAFQHHRSLITDFVFTSNVLENKDKSGKVSFYGT